MIEKIENIMRRALPSPFSIAIVLTIIIIILSLLITDYKTIEILSFWETGLWNAPLMNFAMQMMLMLVLGYVIALTNNFKKLISKITQFCNNTSSAACLVAFATIDAAAIETIFLSPLIHVLHLI